MYQFDFNSIINTIASMNAPSTKYFLKNISDNFPEIIHQGESEKQVDKYILIDKVCLPIRDFINEITTDILKLGAPSNNIEVNDIHELPEQFVNYTLRASIKTKDFILILSNIVMVIFNEWRIRQWLIEIDEKDFVDETTFVVILDGLEFVTAYPSLDDYRIEWSWVRSYCFLFSSLKMLCLDPHIAINMKPTTDTEIEEPWKDLFQLIKNNSQNFPIAYELDYVREEDKVGFRITALSQKIEIENLKVFFTETFLAMVKYEQNIREHIKEFSETWDKMRLGEDLNIPDDVTKELLSNLLGSVYKWPETFWEDKIMRTMKEVL